MEDRNEQQLDTSPSESAAAMSSNDNNTPDETDVEVADEPQDVGEATEDHRSDSEVMSEQISLLESQLQEKEDLVFALTERLEQAAEQLDRFRRTGAKQGRGGGGGMSPELLAEQKSLFEDMRQMISQWEATQPGATLGRIEMQVTELRDLVSGNVLGGGNASSEQQVSSGISDVLESLKKQGDPPPAAQSSESDAPKPGSWEAQKAALMAGDPLPTNTAAPTQSAEAVDETKTEPQAATGEDEFTPKPINFEEADIEQLRSGILERDEIIASLKERLQQGGGSGEVVKYDTMESMPDEFREKLEALEEEWKDKIRETEVELSLERAKIAREMAELQQQQHQLQKERENMGVGSRSGNRGGNRASADEQEESGGGRWLRFLKRGNDDDDE